MTTKAEEEEEEWMPFPEWEDYYEISDMGRVRSIRRAGIDRPRFGVRFYGGGIVKQLISNNGYPKVNLTKKGKRSQRNIHRIVLRAFRGEPEHGQYACHNNGIKLDCRLSNLRWDSAKGNKEDDRLHGKLLMGESVSNAKLTNDLVCMIRKSSLSAIALAKLIGVSQSTVLRVKNKEAWRHVQDS